MKRLLVILPFLLLAACAKSAENSATTEAAPAAAMAPPPSGGASGRMAAMDSDAGAAESTTAPSPTAPSATPAAVTVTAPLLAYTYTYELEAQAAKMRALMAQHIKECTAAGPTVCQVVGANQEKTENDAFSGQVEFRAAPAWLTRFRDGIEPATQAAGGRVVSANTSSEDLTRAIVDTEAALRAKTVLRGRLEGLLANRDGKLSELLEVERELARVQTEIDATQSELAVMRTRVATSKLIISYHSEGALADPGDVSPLKQALNSFVGIVLGSISVMIYIVAFTLPWALLVALLLWLFRKRLPKFGKKKPAAEAAAPPAA